MANRHFGKLSDVWKHVALAEVLEREPPRRYAETHAGSGAYPIVRDEERQFGILRFLDVAADYDVLAHSRYRAVTSSYLDGHGVYPGSALLAMTMLGDASSYLLCDMDTGSAADLRRWARELRVQHCEVAQADGMVAVAAWLDRQSDTQVLVHIDPFDPDASGPGGCSAIELAAQVAACGTPLVYWYGYDEPGDQAWAYPRLTAQTRAPLWCGDVMVGGTSRTSRRSWPRHDARNWLRRRTGQSPARNDRRLRRPGQCARRRIRRRHATGWKPGQSHLHIQVQRTGGVKGAPAATLGESSPCSTS